jgi:hypothetical protein
VASPGRRRRERHFLPFSTVACLGGWGEYEITADTSSVALTKYVRHASTRDAARAEERGLKQAQTDEALPVAR